MKSMMNRLRRKSAVGLATVTLAVASVMAVAAPAQAATGRVTCATSSVVGMWIDVNGGTDGWATLTSTASPNTKYWSYNTQGKSWRAFVGCGGSSQSWGSSNVSPWTSKSAADLICNDVPGYNTCTV
jgi:hypothetical protein